MSILHCTDIHVGFKHCDPAGIVFYPRYVEMLNDTVEHWFAFGLGCDFATLHQTRGLAIPLVKLNVEFHSPSRLSEMLEAALGVVRLGSKSMDLRVEIRAKNAEAQQPPKLVAHLTVVFASMTVMRSEFLPNDLRMAAERYLIA